MKCLYNLLYTNLKVNNKESDGQLHIISAEEKEIIKRKERFSVITSAVIGAVMVILYAYPVNYYSFFIYDLPIYNPFATEPFKIPIITLLYGFVLVIIELILLTLLDIYSTHQVASAIGFINKENKNEYPKKEYIINFGTQKNIKKIHELGLNPFFGISKRYFILLNIIFKLKATFSNYLIRYFFSKLSGRYATRIVLDIAGIPVFAFWNAWGTQKLIKDARIHLVGLAYINILIKEIKEFRKICDQEKQLVYDLLQFIVVSKRDYHLNHYELSKLILTTFEIKIEKDHVISETFIYSYKNSNPDFKKILTKILIIGFLLDGKISKRELKRLHELRLKNVIIIEGSEIKKYLQQFKYGNHLEIF